MAAADFSAWQPIIWDDNVVQEAPQPSLIATYGTPFNMRSNIHELPRHAGAKIGGGSALTADTTGGDTVQLPDWQYNGLRPIDEAQSEDTPADEIEALSFSWLNDMNVAYDNACLGVTAARSTTVGNYRPYNSVYNTVRASDTDVSYVADTNYTLAGTLNYDNLSGSLGQIESTRYYSDQGIVVFAHPTFLDGFRRIKDADDRPIFNESTVGFPGGGQGTVRTLFGHPFYTSFGAVKTDKHMHNASGTWTEGNPLVVFANRRYLVHGKRIEPQVKFISADINTSALEHNLQFRARKGFVLTVPQAASVLEIGA